MTSGTQQEFSCCCTEEVYCLGPDENFLSQSLSCIVVPWLTKQSIHCQNIASYRLFFVLVLKDGQALVADVSDEALSECYIHAIKELQGCIIV